MPGTLTIDTAATFQAVLLMASGPKLKFGSTEQDISARGERKSDVQAAVTYHAEPGMKPVSEVIGVTDIGGTEPEPGCLMTTEDQVRVRAAGELACRPGSVHPLARADGHPSRTAVAGSLMRSTREHRAGRPRSLAQASAARAAPPF